MIDRIPQVFISYSWTNQEYQKSIVDLAARLRHDGVDIKLDVWDLKQGQDKYAYMEQCVTNPAIDKVLIMSDRVYAEKADTRKGGVGDETTVISSEVYKNVNQQKFIPVVMERNEDGEAFLPAYLNSRMYVDFSAENKEKAYEELLRTIFELPEHRKPEIGKRPEWLTEEIPDGLYPLKDAVKKLSIAELRSMKEIAARDFIDYYIEALKQFYVQNIDNDTYLKNFASMKEYRDVFLEHLKTFSSTEHFGDTMADEFENLYNTLYCVDTFIPKARSCGNLEFDLFRLHVWELFVCTVTYMLHFELYSDIHELLEHTYFLRTSGIASERIPLSYEQFRFHSQMMEEIIKPSMKDELSRTYTLTGYYVCTSREYLPIYSGRAMANADLFLYQVYNGLELDDLTQYSAWFPMLYAYADEYDSLWKKLKSKRFCEKIMPIFGVKTIQELKNRIAKCKPDRNYYYSGAWRGHARAILECIDLQEIAILP